MPETCEILDCCSGENPLKYQITPSAGVYLRTESDPADGGTTTGDGDYEVGDSVTVTATPEVPTSLDVGVDICFVCDESGSMSDIDDIMESVVTGLEARFNAAGIGTGTVTNRYSLVAFGMQGPPEVEIAFSSYAAFLIAIATVGPRDLGNPAFAEDAYGGIDHAVNQLPWRDETFVSKLLFFITDEDRNVHTYANGADQAAQFINLKAELVAGEFLLAGMFTSSISGIFNGGATQSIIACDYTINPAYEGDGSETSLVGTSYYADGAGGYIVTTGVDTITPNWLGNDVTFPTGIQEEYFDLVMDQVLRGYYFNLTAYRELGLKDDSVIAVIVPALADRITQELVWTFIGWFNAGGELVSENTSYTFNIMNNTVLTARFMYE